jgi:hypothetical protein
MIMRKRNSAQQAAKDSMLAPIELAVQRVAFKANGGVVEVLGTTKARTLSISRVHQMTMQSSKIETRRAQTT